MKPSHSRPTLFHSLPASDPPRHALDWLVVLVIAIGLVIMLTIALTWDTPRPQAPGDLYPTGFCPEARLVPPPPWP